METDVFSRITANVLSGALMLLYVAIATVMWVSVSQFEDDQEDKSRAAMIGAASAFTAGGAAVAGGWFNGWRTSRLQQARDDKEKRREAYARLLGTLSDYRRASAEVKDFKQIIDKGAAEDVRGLAEEKLVAAQAHARGALLSLEQAFAGAELVATDAVREAMAPLMHAATDGKPGEASIDESKSSAFVDAARRDLGFE